MTFPQEENDERKQNYQQNITNPLGTRERLRVRIVIVEPRLNSGRIVCVCVLFGPNNSTIFFPSFLLFEMNHRIALIVSEIFPCQICLEYFVSSLLSTSQFGVYLFVFG